ncbi:MAG: ABC transporter substrate-binding protein [bacterium]|nr:ABC transporter substrate-binding protein [bacterium]
MVFGLVAAACGNDDDDGVATAPEEPAPAEPADDGDDAPAPAPADDGDDAPAPEPADDGDDAPDPAPADDGDDGEAPPEEEPMMDACEATVPGTQIDMGVFSETRGLDPIVTSGSGVTGMTELSTLYDQLMVYDHDLGDYRPHLAESLTSNDDLTEWTLTLRPGITFPDGTPLDTAAVQYSLNRFVTEDALNGSSAFIAWIEEMEIIDNLTMVLHLDRPWGTFPYALADEPGMVVNPTVVEAMGTEEFNLNPVDGGVGPYNIERYAPGEEIVVTAKDDYWGGPVCVETIRFIRIPGAPATYEAFQNDEINVAFLREARTIADAVDSGDDENAFSSLQNGGSSIFMNNGVRGSTPPTTDLRLREAIALAVDVDVLNQRSNEGLGKANTALMHPDSVYYDAALFPEVQQDLDRARVLVQEVKDETGWDGSIRLACHNAPSRIDWAIAVVALLEAAGFEVELDNDGTILDLITIVLRNADFDLACWGFNIADETPFFPMIQFRSDARNNRIGYADPNMDAAIDQLQVATNTEQIQAALAEIWRVWQQSWPSAITESVQELIILKPEVKGVIATQVSALLFHDAYIDEG